MPPSDKTREILSRLKQTKENLGVLSQLLTEALSKLENVTKKMADENEYIPRKTVNDNWVPRSSVEEFMSAKALLEQCKLELEDIDKATIGVSEALDPIMTKIKPKPK